MSDLPIKSIEDKKLAALATQVRYGAFVKATMIATMVLSLIMLSVLLNISSINTKLIQQLDDCISPDGTCFKAAALSEDTNVTNIQEVSIYASYCARKPGVVTIEQTRSCIETEIRKAKK